MIFVCVFSIDFWHCLYLRTRLSTLTLKSFFVTQIVIARFDIIIVLLQSNAV
jgi:hypothetical protein